MEGPEEDAGDLSPRQRLLADTVAETRSLFRPVSAEEVQAASTSRAPSYASDDESWNTELVDMFATDSDDAASATPDLSNTEDLTSTVPSPDVNNRPPPIYRDYREFRDYLLTAPTFSGLYVPLLHHAAETDQFLEQRALIDAFFGGTDLNRFVTTIRRDTTPEDILAAIRPDGYIEAADQERLVGPVAMNDIAERMNHYLRRYRQPRTTTPPPAATTDSTAPAATTDSTASAATTDSTASAATTDSATPAATTDSAAPAATTDSAAPAATSSLDWIEQYVPDCAREGEDGFLYDSENVKLECSICFNGITANNVVPAGMILCPHRDKLCGQCFRELTTDYGFHNSQSDTERLRFNAQVRCPMRCETFVPGECEAHVSPSLDCARCMGHYNLRGYLRLSRPFLDMLGEHPNFWNAQLYENGIMCNIRLPNDVQRMVFNALVNQYLQAVANEEPTDDIVDRFFEFGEDMNPSAPDDSLGSTSTSGYTESRTGRFSVLLRLKGHPLPYFGPDVPAHRVLRLLLPDELTAFDYLLVVAVRPPAARRRGNHRGTIRRADVVVMYQWESTNPPAESYSYDVSTEYQAFGMDNALRPSKPPNRTFITTGTIRFNNQIRVLDSQHFGQIRRVTDMRLVEWHFGMMLMTADNVRPTRHAQWVDAYIRWLAAANTFDEHYITRLSSHSITQRRFGNFFPVDGQAIRNLPPEADVFWKGCSRRGQVLPDTLPSEQDNEADYYPRRLFVVPFLLQFIGAADYGLTWSGDA